MIKPCILETHLCLSFNASGQRCPGDVKVSTQCVCCECFVPVSQKAYDDMAIAARQSPITENAGNFVIIPNKTRLVRLVT